MKVAINGFGRIGRMILRAYIEKQPNDIEIIAINDLQDIDTSIHLLKYDSVHGRLNATVEKSSDSSIKINGNEIKYISERNPENLPWRNLNVDLVMECTGVFKTREACTKHLNAGASKVLLSCPGNDLDKTIVFGVNDHTLTPDDILVSNGSCTTNCLAPVVNVLNSEFGISGGFVSTIHAYTGDQRLVDTSHKDLRRARAAASNIIPTSTGAAEAIANIFPELTGKLSGIAYRVPTQNVSLIECTFVLNAKTTATDINQKIKEWATTKMPEVLGFTDEQLVSCDFCHSSFSSIVDLSLTKVIENIAHITSWYDNEWGFSCRMLDTAKRMFS